MTHRITPALPDREWKRLEDKGEAQLPIRGGVRRTDIGDIAIWTYGSVVVPKESLPALVAIANALMPVNDARRLTRQTIADLDWVLEQAGPTGDHTRSVADVLRPIRDALASFLPPDPDATDATY